MSTEDRARVVALATRIIRTERTPQGTRWFWPLALEEAKRRLRF